MKCVSVSIVSYACIRMHNKRRVNLMFESPSDIPNFITRSFTSKRIWNKFSLMSARRWNSALFTKRWSLPHALGQHRSLFITQRRVAGRHLSLSRTQNYLLYVKRCCKSIKFFGWALNTISKQKWCNKVFRNLSDRSFYDVRKHRTDFPVCCLA